MFTKFLVCVYTFVSLARAVTMNPALFQIYLEAKETGSGRYEKSEPA